MNTERVAHNVKAVFLGKEVLYTFMLSLSEITFQETIYKLTSQVTTQIFDNRTRNFNTANVKACHWTW
jgi:hypothetical protein